MCHSAFFYQAFADEYYGEWNDVSFYATKLCDTYGLDTMDVDLMISWLHGCYEAGILTDENTGIPISKLGSLEFMEALVKLRGCEMHSTHLMESGDENPLKQLGLEITTDARLYFPNNNDRMRR